MNNDQPPAWNMGKVLTINCKSTLWGLIDEDLSSGNCCLRRLGISYQVESSYNVRPGLCVIINNMVFAKATELPDGKKDEQDMAVLFTTLGFDVKIHENLTAKEMVKKAEFYGRKQHRGAFFFIILSHGPHTKEVIIGTDCEPVTIHQLKSFYFTSDCPSLHGVPKIFIIDAFRGSNTERLYSPEHIRNMVARNSSVSLATADIASAHASPGIDSAHFMTIYASTHGNVAFTDCDRGNRFMQAFVEVTKQAGFDTSFTRIIQNIRAKIEESNSQQTVEYVDTLICDYFIKREEYMPSVKEMCNKFKKALQHWIAVREDTIQQICNTIETLKFHHRNINVSHIAGSTMSIIGSTISLASIVMAPATGGLSLVLPVSGVALALAGGGTSAGASIADVLIQQSNVKQAQEQLKRDYELLYIISALATAIHDEDARQQCEGVSKAKLLAVLGYALTQGVFRTGNLGVRIAGLFAVAFAALKIGGTAPVGVVSTALIDAARSTIGSIAGRTIAFSVGEALGGGTGSALGKAMADLIAPKASGIAGVSAGSAVAKGLAKGLAKVGVVLNVVTIPIDLVEIIRSSTNLADGSETEAIKQLTNIVEQLENEKKAIEVALEQTPLSHSESFEEAKVQAKTPFLYHRLLECDSSGKEFHIEDHDITLTIPEGAVSEGKKLYLEVGVTMYGPFVFPENTQPISPILWLCPLDEDFVVNKPIQIKLPHFLTGLSTEKLQDHKVRFMKATHMDKVDRQGQTYYKFQNTKGSEEFISNDVGSKSFGTLATKHCCFYCIEANKSPMMTLDATYYLIRIENSSHPNYELHFAAIYYLKTCLKAVREQYPENNGYVIRPPKSFKFEENKTEPYTVMHLKITIPEDERYYTIGMEPILAEIHATDINFWERNLDIEEMRLQHDNQMYPPRVKMTVTMRKNDPITLPITFSGTLMSNHRLDLKLTFPLVRMDSATLVKSSTAQCNHLSITDLRKVQDSTWEARTNWYNLGLGLEITPNSLDAIELANTGNPDRCFRAMLTQWLRRDSPRPTWTALAEALRSPSVGLTHLAEEILQQNLH